MSYWKLCAAVCWCLWPQEIYLWDLNTGRLARKYTGQRQGNHVIRSCFGGIEGNFVVSGSEGTLHFLYCVPLLVLTFILVQDGKVYVWHRDTGTLLETLAGHGDGSVNSAAWNPRNERMFATCSDDHTIRIWEAPVAQPHMAELSINGKGKTRQMSNGDNAEYESTFGTWIDG